MKTINKKTTIMTSITIATLLITGSSFMGTSIQNANAAFLVIDFDLLAGGTSVTTQFESQGAHFSSSGGDPRVLVDPGEAISDPNILVGFAPGNVGPIWIDIVDGSGNPTVTDEVSVNVISVGGMELTVTAKNTNGDPIGIPVVLQDLIGPCNGLDNVDPVSFSGIGPIASVHFEVTTLAACGGDGYGIDDVIIGDLLEVIEECSDDDEICKTIVIVHDDHDPNGYIEPHEPVSYITTITAQNPTDFDWEDVKVQDNLGGDLTIGDANPPENRLTTTDNLVCDVKLKGKTEKVQIRCDVAEDGTLDPQGAETAILGFTAETDFNPGQGKKAEGKLEYTSCGIHYANSGATVSGFDTDSQTSFAFSTDGIFVEVFTDDKAGDCDGDTIIDSDEETNGTNPFARDTDDDGSDDNLDNCPATANPGQENNYGTSLGDACEDTDTDGILDDADNCPTVFDPTNLCL